MAYCPRCHLLIEEGETTVLADVVIESGDGYPRTVKEAAHQNCPPRCAYCGFRFTMEHGPTPVVMLIGGGDGYSDDQEITVTVHAGGCPRQ